MKIFGTKKKQSRMRDFGFSLRYEICQFTAINVAKRVNLIFTLSE